MNMAKLLPLRRLVALLSLLAVPMPALAQTGPASLVPLLKPTAVLSLEYPNPWDFNKLIALTSDGRYLVDASDKTRHIRVWDWQERTVAKRLLLNEAAPEFNDGKVHKSVLSVAGGHELTLSPDGRYMAACANKWTMIWDLGSSQRLARVGGLLDPAPGIPEGARVEHGCRWLSFSPDGSWLAVADGGTLFLTEKDWEASEQAAARRSERLTREPGKFTLTPQDYADMARGKDKSFTGGVALYDTQDWRIVRFLRLRPWEHVKSPVLFTADGKQAIGLAYQYPAVFPKEVINTPAAENYVTSRLVRWDVATGEIVASMELPKLAPGSVNVKWSWLPGGREVWWQTWLRVDYEYQTEMDVWNCKAPPPAFESEVAENCGYGTRRGWRRRRRTRSARPTMM